jgi:glucose-6-phosphate 1-dehydrogenase
MLELVLKKIFSVIEKRLKKEKEWGMKPNILFYLSVKPQLFPVIAKGIATIQDTHHCTIKTAELYRKTFWT